MKESRALTRARTFVGFLETWRYGVLLLVAVHVRVPFPDA